MSVHDKSGGTNPSNLKLLGTSQAKKKESRNENTSKKYKSEDDDKSMKRKRDKKRAHRLRKINSNTHQNQKIFLLMVNAAGASYLQLQRTNLANSSYF